MVYESCNSNIKITQCKKKGVPVYQIESTIGKGAYGEVFDIMEVKSHVHYALKKCINIFDSRRAAIGTLTELRLGRLLNHRNISKLEEILIPDNITKFQGIYYRTKLMKTNLAKYLKKSKYLPLRDIKYIFFQLISALYYIHKRNVIHCDIKPDNILIGSNNKVKLCDFGLACVMNPAIGPLKYYTTTRWYRAPEVILAMNYNESIDIWSIGCVLGELLLGKPLFQGANNFDQLTEIVNVLGCPEDLSWVNPSQKSIFLIHKDKKSRFDEMFNGCDGAAVRLLSHLLVWNPKKRYTAQQILYDPFFQDLDSNIKKEYQEINERSPCDPIVVDYDRKDITMDEIRRLIIEEINYYHPIY